MSRVSGQGGVGIEAQVLAGPEAVLLALPLLPTSRPLSHAVGVLHSPGQDTPQTLGACSFLTGLRRTKLWGMWGEQEMRTLEHSIPFQISSISSLPMNLCSVLHSTPSPRQCWAAGHQRRTQPGSRKPNQAPRGNQPVPMYLLIYC